MCDSKNLHNNFDLRPTGTLLRASCTNKVASPLFSFGLFQLTNCGASRVGSALLLFVVQCSFECYSAEHFL